MSDYCGKVLELVDIETEDDKSYLLINLAYEQQQVKLYWEMDSLTAQHLKEISHFQEAFKYRLSLYCQWDRISKQYRSFITKTHRNYSERFSFVCSENFNNQLAEICRMKTIDDLKDLPFLTMNQLAHEEKSIQGQQIIEQLQEAEGIQRKSENH